MVFFFLVCAFAWCFSKCVFLREMVRIRGRREVEEEGELRVAAPYIWYQSKKILEAYSVDGSTNSM
jgi:hypothetical protein